MPLLLFPPKLNHFITTIFLVVDMSQGTSPEQQNILGTKPTEKTEANVYQPQLSSVPFPIEGQQRQSRNSKPIEMESEYSGNLEEKKAMALDVYWQSKRQSEVTKEAGDLNCKTKMSKLNHWKGKVDDLQHQLSDHESCPHALQHHLDVREAEVEATRAERDRLQSELNGVTALLETRTLELKSAQVFLTTADGLSGTEVMALVDGLNHEIMQTCALISDSFDFARKPEHAAEIKAAYVEISKFMAPTMMHLLSTVQHREDPLLVQIALQSAMIEYSRWCITTWDYGQLGVGDALTTIYSKMVETKGKFAHNRHSQVPYPIESQNRKL